MFELQCLNECSVLTFAPTFECRLAAELRRGKSFSACQSANDRYDYTLPNFSFTIIIQPGRIIMKNEKLNDTKILKGCAKFSHVDAACK